MQEAASKFSTRNELIAFNFSFLFVGFGFFSFPWNMQIKGVSPASEIREQFLCWDIGYGIWFGRAASPDANFL